MPFGGQGTDGVFGGNDPVVDPASPMMIGMPNPIPGNAASHVSYTGLQEPRMWSFSATLTTTRRYMTSKSAAPAEEHQPLLLLLRLHRPLLQL